MALLEIIAFNVASAIAAEKAGADRLELCENSAFGGTTPSYGFIRFCIENISIPCFPMIRPRGGNFVYTAEELQIIYDDIAACKTLGCKGIVTGMLLPNRHIDVDSIGKIVELAYPMEVSFHRAFDRCLNPETALEEIINAGCTRLLSSGQKPTALEGATLLQKLMNQANGRITIMPGSGVRSSTLQEIAEQTQAHEFHSSAALRITSMDNQHTNMEENFVTETVDADEIRKMKTILSASTS